jgi:hypothetical protein
MIHNAEGTESDGLPVSFTEAIHLLMMGSWDNDCNIPLQCPFFQGLRG